MDMYEIVMKLIGDIDPCGDNTIDEDRYQNLDELGDLIIRLVDRVAPISHQRYRLESSIEKIGNLAYRDLQTVKHYIQNEFD